MTASTSTFNCTSCGAGQDLLGGGRVRVHVCGYCGSELDVQDGFKVIAQFRDMVRPDTPFDLGMEGELWGVPFTVIGTIGWIEHYGHKVWTWVDHQIFSPTHGYAWLTVDDGHVVYTRKTREVPDPPFLGAATIESSEHRPSVQLGGRTFRYYGSGQAQPTFIEGSFNYVPSMDDRVSYVELLCGHEMLAMAGKSNEREYELSRMPDRAEVTTSFGLAPESLPDPLGVHPLDVFDRAPDLAFIRNAALLGGAFSVGLALMFWTIGDTIQRTERLSVESPISVPFEVTQGDRLTKIEIWADASNSWAWFEAELLGADGEAVAGFERGVEYYHGRSGGESWSEGSQRATTKLKLAEGAYTLELERTGGEVDWSNGSLARNMQVTISEGHTNPMWLLVSALLLLGIGGAFLAQRGLHNARRWAGSDWSDD